MLREEGGIADRGGCGGKLAGRRRLVFEKLDETREVGGFQRAVRFAEQRAREQITRVAAQGGLELRSGGEEVAELAVFREVVRVEAQLGVQPQLVLEERMMIEKTVEDAERVTLFRGAGGRRRGRRRLCAKREQNEEQGAGARERSEK